MLPRAGIAATVGESDTTTACCSPCSWWAGAAPCSGDRSGDRFGRVRTLTLTILCYSLFTFAGALATNVWQLAVFRFLAGVGIGGEWTLGGTFVAEEWPERRRARAPDTCKRATTSALCSPQW